LTTAEFIRRAKAAGWDVTVTGSSHLRFDHPDASTSVFSAGTSGDRRWHLNMAAQLRRALPERRTTKVPKPRRKRKPARAPKPRDRRESDIAIRPGAGAATEYAGSAARQIPAPTAAGRTVRLLPTNWDRT
jgi:hypothetical protein